VVNFVFMYITGNHAMIITSLFLFNTKLKLIKIEVYELNNQTPFQPFLTVGTLDFEGNPLRWKIVLQIW